MLDLKATWEQLIQELERETDELRLKVHLGGAEARDLFEKVDRKVGNLRARTQQIFGEAQDSAGKVQESAKAMVAEIRKGFKRIHNLL